MTQEKANVKRIDPLKTLRVIQVSHLEFKGLVGGGIHDVADLTVERQGEPRLLTQYLVLTAGELSA